jgi:diguanylate cyclase (GGDEF)-like protein
MTEAVAELPADKTDAPPSATTYAPYSQLIKMLLPRSISVTIFDHVGELAWSSDGYARPEITELLEMHKTDVDRGHGRIYETSSGQAAFLEHLNSENRRLGSVVVELGPSRSAWNDKVVRGLLRPVLRCLENCLELEQSIETSGGGGDAIVDLLIGIDEDNPAGPSPLHRLLRHIVEQLQCSIGALVVTSKNLTVTWDIHGNDSSAATQLLNRTQRNLLAWAQLNNRTMLVNRVGAGHDAPSYKILSCPIQNASGNVDGVLALFREADQTNFDLRDVRILEFIARRVVAILHSRHDSLTGLPNKLVFEARVQAELNHSDGSHALLYVDIDRLQSINEAFGYQSGDDVIQRLAEAVQQLLRPIDMACRLSGDRIAVYLKNVELAGAGDLAQNLVDRMSGLSYLRDQHSLSPTVSVGVVKPAPGVQKFAHVLAAAEIACKEAKHLGGNCVVSDHQKPLVHRERVRRTDPGEKLREALAHNEFRLQVQPIVGLSLSTGETLGQEILLRLRDKEGSLIAPEKFLDIAQRFMLMDAIDRWVLSTTVASISESNKEFGEPAHQITINVSEQSLKGQDYPEFALEEIARAGLSNQMFRFDLRESVAIEHVGLAGPFMKQMRNAGCQVGLDDFGVRLSSFADLKDLPVQYLKIDGGLIRRVEDDRYAESVVKGIVRAAEILGVFTIAEHVESESLAIRLQELEINYGQGFHFGRPRPLEDLLKATDSAE